MALVQLSNLKKALAIALGWLNCKPWMDGGVVRGLASSFSQISTMFGEWSCLDKKNIGVLTPKQVYTSSWNFLKFYFAYVRWFLVDSYLWGMDFLGCWSFEVWFYKCFFVDFCLWRSRSLIGFVVWLLGNSASLMTFFCHWLILWLACWFRIVTLLFEIINSFRFRVATCYYLFID